MLVWFMLWQITCADIRRLSLLKMAVKFRMSYSKIGQFVRKKDCLEPWMNLQGGYNSRKLRTQISDEINQVIYKNESIF
jgi:hypothetical protein